MSKRALAQEPKLPLIGSPADELALAPVCIKRPGGPHLLRLGPWLQALVGIGLLAVAVAAQALGLGRLTVQSALGEPLRAEIEIVQITPEEAASLAVRVAGPEAFRAAGMDYNTVLSGLQITLQRRPDGRPFLLLAAPRPVQDPFLDLILEASWASGRLVRDYTLLFDPPALRSPATARAPSAVLPPAASTATPTPADAARDARPQVADGARRPDRQAARDAAPGRSADRKPKTDKPAESEPVDGYVVKQGDTLGRIAEQYRGEAASLDQMLIALLNANPDAFVAKNINRLKAGSVLKVPSAQQAAQTPARQASQQVMAQSRDFNEYRRSLAGLAPASPQDGKAARTAAGKAEVKVDDARRAAAAADKLKLEKGAASGAKAADAVATDRAKAEASARVAELNRNMADLARVAASAATGATASAGVTASAGSASTKTGTGLAVGAPAAAPAAAKTSSPTPTAAVSAAVKPASAPVAPAPAKVQPGVQGPTPSSPAATPSISAAQAPAPAAGSGPVVAAKTPSAAITPSEVAASAPGAGPSSNTQTAVVPKKAVATPPPPPPPEPFLLDQLMENPMVPAGAVGIVALLAGFGVYRLKRRKGKGPNAGVDSSFLESRLQPDSFFGASGGQRIDTKDGPLSGSSMVYSPSQLEAAGDVDPVAEADVYLAYGRDLQAEEILKEAIRTQPARVSVRIKLLEIYAKRRDARGFEALAAETFRLAGGTDSADWDRIREMGSALEPENPLYQSGAVPVDAAAPPAAPERRGADGATSSMLSPSTLPSGLKTAAKAAAPVASAAQPDVDLDLDFLSPDEPAAGMAATQPVSVDVVRPEQSATLDISFDLDAAVTAAEPTVSMVQAPPEAPVDLDAGLSFELPDAPPPAAAASSQLTGADDGNALSFDLGGISLDLPGSPTLPAAASSLADGTDPNDPEAETKLALADEFRQIGDAEAARQLVLEVIATARGDLKAKAQRLLSELG